MPRLNTQKVQELLKHKKLKLVNLANHLSVDSSAVSHWMNHRSFPAQENLERMAELFEVESDSLIEEIPPGLVVQSPDNQIYYTYNNYSISSHTINIFVSDTKEAMEMMERLTKRKEEAEEE